MQDKGPALHPSIQLKWKQQSWKAISQHLNYLNLKIGETKEYGACTGLKRTQNPVLLSEVIRVNSKHSYLGFDSADQFAMTHGLPMQDPDYFLTERRKKQLVVAAERKITARDHDLLQNEIKVKKHVKKDKIRKKGRENKEQLGQLSWTRMEN